MMKKQFILLLIALAGCLSSFGQEYTWSFQTNPDFGVSNSPAHIAMKGGKLYQTYYASATGLNVSVYDPLAAQWSLLDQYTLGLPLTKIQTVFINDLLYIVAGSNTEYRVYSFDPATASITLLPGALSVTMPSSNWVLKRTASGSDLYILRVENYTNVFLSGYSIGSNVWSANNTLTSQLNPSASFGVSSATLELYVSQNRIYTGVSGTDDIFGSAPLSNSSNFTFYNTSGANNGRIYIDGTPSSVSEFYFTGDGNAEPTVHVRHTSLMKTWSTPITVNNIDISSASAASIDFNVYQGAYKMLENPAYTFLCSAFSSLGSFNADKFYLYRMDNATSIWDSVGPKIQFGQPMLNSGTVFLALDNAQQHMAVQWGSSLNNGMVEMAVLNRKPYVAPASVNANSGLCPGHTNEIYSQLEYYDDDGDQTRILNVYSLNGVITNMSAIGAGYVSGIPGLAKFRIYGTFTSSAQDRVIVTYTDGWNTFNDTLPFVSATVSAPNVTFSSSPLVLCNNENLIDLTNYVSYVDNGVFSINGNDMQSTVIDGRVLSQTTPNGTINYRVGVAGCWVETGVSFSFASVGVANATATPADCGSTNGTAQVNFNPGTSSNVTVEWSTGETASSIGNLSPGAYYYAVKDEFGCNVTGFTNVDINGISATANVTNASCNGANDGSISLTVNGSADYAVLWSNGYSTPTISNLAPGNYEVTVYDAGGCQATYSYTVTEPTAITASFTDYEPDCGLSNGDIYGVYNGGGGNYTFNWIGTGQTTADLFGVPYGLYQVNVTDANGCSRVFDYQLDDYQAIDILDSVIPASCGIANGAIVVKLQPDANNGPGLLGYTWSNGNPAINNFNLAPGQYTITASSGPSPFNGNTCYAQKTITVGTRAPLPQEICMVTVDTSTTTNLVVWQRAESDGISHYNIYRENAVAGNFMLIDTVQVGSESLFNDVVASPMDRSWRYKISAVNTCGQEGAVSATHKTMHLNTIVNLGNGSNDIYWDDYEGRQEVEYIVWRFSDQNGWESLTPAVPFGISVFNDSPPVGLTGIDYFVEMSLSSMCTATRAQDFNSARSNKEKGQFSTGQGTGDSNNDLAEMYLGSISLFPNPVTHRLTVVQAENQPVAVVIRSAEGSVIDRFVLTSTETQLDLNTYAKGVYFVSVALDQAQQTHRIVKL